MPVSFVESLVSGGGGGPNPTDTFSIGVVAPESNAAPTDPATFAMTAAYTETNATPTETAKLGLSGYTDSNTAPTEARTTVARYYLSGSSGTTNVTNPANANGQNDGTSSSQQTAAAGATTSTLTANCGSGIGSVTFAGSQLFRGWFVATVPLNTSTVKIVAHSTTAAYTDVTVLSTTVAVNSSGGTFTFDLGGAGINTLAKLQSTQFLFSTTDVAAGVSPAVLTVDAACIELTLTI